MTAHTAKHPCQISSRNVTPEKSFGAGHALIKQFNGHRRKSFEMINNYGN